MKINKELTTYCKFCKKHTKHTVKNYTKKAQRGLSLGTRRHNRAIKGYVGSIEPKIHPKKLGKKQKVMIECAQCKKTSEMVFGMRTKKKLEITR
ncbi:MAG: 50S ribosomal protein L44e [Candidatus Micrarchaeota archaeon]|nr:50S ribosomal protein L44e [Candidatus Micrarchaeota archaeon]MDE1834642.1 50S ribosomal protein L44e [Candidatus Micrarchaeota archaeon]MDE1860075.1 50S ribosomal protein L44e [Candidatus Micrarchaeota archaeon]